jgi:phosphoribosylaminoimidazole-succinocarboxamide synthase
MSPASPVAQSFVRSGKVRDLYAIGEDRLLLVASDRLSAFDVVLPTEIPDKGRVLTGLSRFWFSRTQAIVPNHLVGVAPYELPPEFAEDAGVRPPAGRGGPAEHITAHFRHREGDRASRYPTAFDGLGN